MKKKIMEIRTVTITRKGQISIPNSIRKSKGFKEGSKIGVIVYDDRVELRSMNKISEKLSTAFASERVLAKDWKSKEDDKAWRNL